MRNFLHWRGKLPDFARTAASGRSRTPTSSGGRTPSPKVAGRDRRGVQIRNLGSSGPPFHSDVQHLVKSPDPGVERLAATGMKFE